MKVILSVLLIFILFCEVSPKISENDLQDEYSEYNKKIYEKYIQMDKQLKSIADQSVKRLLPYFLEAGEHVNISADCTRNLFELVTGFRKLTNWSFNFLDALGKIQSGINTGNIQMFGEYEECVDTIVMKNEKVEFQGQYCSIAMKPLLPKVKKVPGLNGRLEGLVKAMSNSSAFTKTLLSRVHVFYSFEVNLGVCVPSGCSKQDISEIVKYLLDDYLNTTVGYCLKKGDIYFWTPRRTVFVLVFFLLGVIVIISTWLDNTLESWKNNNLNFKSRILQCFSLTRNFTKLMNTDVPEKSITCLNGVRVLTLFWIILGHEYFLHAVSLVANHSANYEKMLPKFFSQIAINGFMNVDMFFFMSGFVNCYTRMLIHQDGKSQPGVFKMILHRLWRIYPTYIVAFLLLYLLSKPQPYTYKLNQEAFGNCDLYWWRNILFINNFFDPYKLCMPHTWFLCVDMQLFLVTLLTVPIFFKKPKRAVIIHVIIILVVNICSMSWWLLDDLAPATFDGTRLDRNDVRKSFFIYGLAPVHVGSYIIGILLGYTIATKKEFKISKVIQLFGWLVASVFFTSTLFLTVRWNSGIPYTQLESSLYGAWSRTVMVLGFSWLVFCCATGHAGLINYILSLKLWVPLARISYMLYLVSPLVQGHYYGHISFPEDFSDMRIIWNYFADVSISILLSFALVLIAESPVIALEKVIFRRSKEEIKSSADVPKELAWNNMKENGFQENNGKIITIQL